MLMKKIKYQAGGDITNDRLKKLSKEVLNPFSKVRPNAINITPVKAKKMFELTDSQRKAIAEEERIANIVALNKEKEARRAKEEGTYITLPDGSTKLYKDMDFREKGYVNGQSLRNKGRWNENDPTPTSWFNPVAQLYDMSANIGEAPLKAKMENSIAPYFKAVATPLAVGALAGIGAKTTTQFLNNLANPLAGTGNLVNNLGNKYLPNAYKLNPFAFKPNPNNFYRTIGEQGYEDAAKTGMIRANPQGANAGETVGEINMSRPSDVPYFAKGEIGDYPGKAYVAETTKPLYARGDINPVTNQKIKGRHWGYRNLDRTGKAANLSLEDVKLLKKDWLKGYKEAPKKEEGGIAVDPLGYYNPKNPKKQPILIPSNSITMKNQKGKSKLPNKLWAFPNNDAPVLMEKGNDYFFPNSTQVLEQPFMQKGGKLKPKYVSDPNSKELKAYQDSLNKFNKTDYFKNIGEFYDWEKTMINGNKGRYFDNYMDFFSKNKPIGFRGAKDIEGRIIAEFPQYKKPIQPVVYQKPIPERVNRKRELIRGNFNSSTQPQTLQNFSGSPLTVQNTGDYSYTYRDEQSPSKQTTKKLNTKEELEALIKSQNAGNFLNSEFKGNTGSALFNRLPTFSKGGQQKTPTELMNGLNQKLSKGEITEEEYGRTYRQFIITPEGQEYVKTINPRSQYSATWRDESSPNKQKTIMFPDAEGFKRFTTNNPEYNGQVTQKEDSLSAIGYYTPKMKSGGMNVIQDGKPMYKRADGKVVKRGLWSNFYMSKKQMGGQNLPFPVMQADISRSLEEQKEKSNNSYLDVLNKQNGNFSMDFNPQLMNSVFAALAQRKRQSREENAIQTQLANPFNSIANVTNSSEYMNEGQLVFQDGGEFEDEDEFDDFLWEDEAPEVMDEPEIDDNTEEEIEEEPEYKSILNMDDFEEETDVNSFTPSRSYSVEDIPAVGQSRNYKSGTEQEAYNYLIQKGLPSHVSAGIVGNLIQESGLNPNATGDGGKAYGIAQWHPGRRKNMKNKSFYGQLDFLLNEASQRGDLQKVLKTKTPEEAAYAFAQHFERPKRIENSRMQNARNVFNSFNK